MSVSKDETARDTQVHSAVLDVVDSIRFVNMTILPMNEKTAVVCFPSLDGRMDFTQAFAGKTPEFHGWCCDLYSFYWEKSKKNW